MPPLLSSALNSSILDTVSRNFRTEGCVILPSTCQCHRYPRASLSCEWKAFRVRSQKGSIFLRPEVRFTTRTDNCSDSGSKKSGRRRSVENVRVERIGAALVHAKLSRNYHVIDFEIDLGLRELRGNQLFRFPKSLKGPDSYGICMRMQVDREDRHHDIVLRSALAGARVWRWTANLPLRQLPRYSVVFPQSRSCHLLHE